MKFLKTVLAAVALGVVTAGAAQAQDKGTVGIAMPTKSSARWIADGDNMVKVLQAKGYKTDLQYADDDIPNQLAQIENMVTKGDKVLVIASIDGTTLSNVLQKAADKGVKIIAYDRLIKGSKNVDYYATFDNFQVGVLQASSIEKVLNLKTAKGPFNIELFGGSPDDNNAFFFYNGAMSVLQPYIDSGKLVVQSKQMGMDKVSTLRWDGAVAQALHGQPAVRPTTPARTVDAVLSPYERPVDPGIRCPRSRAWRLRQGRSGDAGGHGPGRGGAVGQVHPRGRADHDDLQGHARARQGHGRHGRRGPRRQGAGDQRHQDLQQRHQDRAVVPAQAGAGGQVELAFHILIDSGYYKESQIK